MEVERITVENVNVRGRLTKVRADMYADMKAAMLKVLPTRSPGLKQSEIREAVLPYLSVELYPGGAKVGWWSKTAQLDMEAKGLIIREMSKPLRWYLAS